MPGMHIVKELKKKPEGTKTNYAFGTALTATLLVTIFWITSLPARFAAYTEATPEESSDTEGGLGAFLDESRTQIGAAIGGVAEDAAMVEESVVTPPTDEPSALGTIRMDEAPGTTTAATSTVPVLVASSTVPLVAGTSTATVTPSRPAPRIIMIATTTSQKQE